MKNLFVGNISFKLRRPIGRRSSSLSGRLDNDHEAAEAIAGLDGKELGGRNLKVNEARPKDERPRAVIAVADAPVVVAATADSRMRITASPPAGRANRAGNPTTLNELGVALDF